VVTGKERGIAASMSYEAKVRGVVRGIRISDIKRVCPEVVLLPSDYETYSLLSQRFYAIVRRFTPDVEEYSIDELFGDLTGLRRQYRASYEAIAARIKHDLEGRTRAATVVTLLGLCGLLFGGCASTAVQAQWADPQFAGRSLRGATALVVCNTSAPAIQRICQDQVAARMLMSGVRPVMASEADLITAEGEQITDKIFAAARRTGADAICCCHRTRRHGRESGADHRIWDRRVWELRRLASVERCWRRHRRRVSGR
jgi:impB/mucB/samB family